jgi:hypothetical protein
MTQQQPPKLGAASAVLRATIQIKRAATGKVEEYTLVGTPVPAQPPKEA